MTRATVRAVHHREPSATNHCLTVTVIGYKAVAGDEWAGPFRRSWQDARADAHEHNAQLQAKAA